MRNFFVKMIRFATESANQLRVPRGVSLSLKQWADTAVIWPLVSSAAVEILNI